MRDNEGERQSATPCPLSPTAAQTAPVVVTCDPIASVFFVLVMSVARCRLFSHLSPPNDRKTQYIKPAAGPRKYIGSKLLHLYGRYEDLLKRYPNLYRVYRVFVEG